MCLTAYWVNYKWTLQKRILNFCVIENNKGENWQENWHFNERSSAFVHLTASINHYSRVYITCILRFFVLESLEERGFGVLSFFAIIAHSPPIVDKAQGTLDLEPLKSGR